MPTIERIRSARKGLKSVRIQHKRNRLRDLRLEASAVLDRKGATRVADESRWVQSYVALKA
jgi:hypothetical protein